MSEQTRWIATVNSDGELEGEPQPYTGYDDDGCQAFVTTDGTAHRAIARTKDKAIEEAKRCWELAQD